MSDFVFNIAKGRVVELLENSRGVGVMLLQVAEQDGFMRKRQTVAEVLGASIEANFTNYDRVSTTAEILRDDANNRTDVDLNDVTWAAAGGGAGNNMLLKLIIFADDVLTDAERIPISAHDFKVTTNGTDLVAEVSNLGFYRAS